MGPYILQDGSYHCVFLRTRLVISVGGFFTTIHNIIDVARQRLYLNGCQHSFVLKNGKPTTAPVISRLRSALMKLRFQTIGQDKPRLSQWCRTETYQVKIYWA